MTGTSIHNGVPVLDRTFDLLDLLERSPDGLAASTLVEELGVPRSTVYRILNSLTARKLVSLAARVRSDVAAVDLAQIATPIMQRLSDETGEPNKLSVRDGDQANIIAATVATPNSSFAPTIASRYPLHAGAASKVIMAHMAADDLARHLSVPLIRYTPRTVTDPKRLARELARVRKLGFATDHGEHNARVHAMAVPVFDVGGRFLAALSIPFLADRDDEFRGRVQRALKTAAIEISRKIPRS
jgi:DNA-binding IclR family transcriptional regulator